MGTCRFQEEDIQIRTERDMSSWMEEDIETWTTGRRYHTRIGGRYLVRQEDMQTKVGGRGWTCTLERQPDRYYKVGKNDQCIRAGE